MLHCGKACPDGRHPVVLPTTAVDGAQRGFSKRLAPIAILGFNLNKMG
jgi:hypothetical protein